MNDTGEIIQGVGADTPMNDRFPKLMAIGFAAVLAVAFLSAVFTAEYITIQTELHSPIVLDQPRGAKP